MMPMAAPGVPGHRALSRAPLASLAVDPQPAEVVALGAAAAARTPPPRVSIGMPVYNGAHFLREVLESLLGQSYADFELIISDNASTDETAAICREFATCDPRISFYRQARNLGGAGNFNFVLAKARGTYFKWAASDDPVRPSLLQRLVDVLEREPGVVLAYPYVDKIGEDGADLGPFSRALGACVGTATTRFARQLRVPGWALPAQVYGLMRTAELRAAGGHGNFPGADLVLVAALSLRGAFAEIPEVLALRRIHANNSDVLYRSDVDLAVGWFGASSAGRSMPKLRRCREYLRAIAAAPLTLGQKAACVGLLAAKLFVGPGAAAGRRVIVREAVATLHRRLAGSRVPR